ncbi:MAG: hypothetical protein Q4A78_12135 [Peptostreptococcaceae bacterium]|nr:hypothetical protein [Peptostreptococcaceae bacterium]
MIQIEVKGKKYLATRRRMQGRRAQADVKNLKDGKWQETTKTIRRLVAEIACREMTKGKVHRHRSKTAI